jgi:signal transduction histidine kinase
LDDGSSGGGHGLVGMRERVAILGGEFEAGATDTGFSVRARFPLTGAEQGR